MITVPSGYEPVIPVIPHCNEEIMELNEAVSGVSMLDCREATIWLNCDPVILVIPDDITDENCVPNKPEFKEEATNDAIASILSVSYPAIIVEILLPLNLDP